METSDGRTRIVFNGEIFNYRELRDQLGSTAGPYTSGTDTEVLLWCLRLWGLDRTLQRLRGMYAFAYADHEEGRVHLVRDPLGVKPLYWRRLSPGFAFASEIKALLSLGGTTPALDRRALVGYLTFGATPGPETMMDGICKVGPGEIMTLDPKGEPRSRRYWRPGPRRSSKAGYRELDAVDRLDEALRTAVSRRLVSDVPVGVFLSGGVDSSLLAAYMSQASTSPVRTFSIGLEGDQTNEFAPAREVATRFRTDHTEISIGESDFISVLDRIAFHLDEPLSDPVVAPLHFLSRAAREDGTPVILVGEGSDEIFAGYPLYHRFARWNRRLYGPYRRLLPSGIRGAVSGLASRTGLPAHLQGALHRAARDLPLFLGNAIAFWDHERDALLRWTPNDENAAAARIRGLRAGLEGGNELDEIRGIELSSRLPELLLMRVDKVSMSQSVETRVPFLDEDVVELALGLPEDALLQRGEAKHILKRVAERHLPESIVYRKKWGFCGSARTILTPGIRAYARERIRSSALCRDLFEPAALGHLLDGRRPGRLWEYQVWTLLVLALWGDIWYPDGGPCA
jgi:asparagine synthase (glutamine-hydrolysing)